jgi:hypothetical protein
MIRVIIGDNERELESVSENWINQQINRRKANGESICAKVFIQKNNIDIGLATPSCPRGQGYRRANKDEQEIINLWEKFGLNTEKFTGGNLVAFLKQLKK